MPPYAALSYRFRVVCRDPHVLEHVATILEGLRAEPGDPELPAGTIDLDALSKDTPEAVSALVGTVNSRAIESARGSLLIHAGAVARDGNGGTLLLCGPSGSGKSTLTAALVRRGHGYATDELVCLDPASLRLTPYRKPLSLRADAQRELPELHVDDSIGRTYAHERWLVPPAVLGSPEAPVGRLIPELLVFPTFAAGCESRLVPLDLAETIQELGANTSLLASVPHGALNCLARLARRAPAYRLTFGEAHQAAALLDRAWAEETA